MVYICGVTSRQRLGKYHENLNISLNHSLMPSPTPKTQIPPILAINRGQKDIEPPQLHRPTRKPQSPCQISVSNPPRNLALPIFVPYEPPAPKNAAERLAGCSHCQK